MFFIDSMKLSEMKTKNAKEAIGKLGTISGFEHVATRRNNALYLILPKADMTVKKSFQNMGNVLVGTVNALNPVDVLTYKYIAFVSPEESMKVIEAKLS